MDRSVLIYIVTFALMTAFYFLYMDDKRKRFPGVPPLVFKGLATACAAAMAFVGAARSGLTADYLLAVGLTVCVAADVILGIRFTWGMAAFALGLVFYCAAYVLTAPPTLPALIVFLTLAGFCVAIYPSLKHHAKQRRASQYLAYALVLCVMLALAIPQRPLLLLGAFLFVASDGMLAYRMARRNKSTLYDYACLACYYIAQYLIALSVFIR